MDSEYVKARERLIYAGVTIAAAPAGGMLALGASIVSAIVVDVEVMWWLWLIVASWVADYRHEIRTGVKLESAPLVPLPPPTRVREIPPGQLF